MSDTFISLENERTYGTHAVDRRPEEWLGTRHVINDSSASKPPYWTGVVVGGYGIVVASIVYCSSAYAGSGGGLDPNRLLRWEVASKKVLYVEDEEQNWFRLDLENNCTNLQAGADLSLVREGGDRRTADLVVVADRQKCPVAHAQHMNASPWETIGIGVRQSDGIERGY